MPIKVPEGLPAIKLLEDENIFLMTENRAVTQDIRPLKIIILNLMPNKTETETQLLRLLGNTPLQIDVDFLQTKSHIAKHTSSEYLLKFYKTFSDVKNSRYDGMIITGAPVERMPFEQVDYWPELCSIMEWSGRNVYSTIHICWGAQAGLFFHYGIKKHLLPKKMSGIFSHRVLIPQHPIARGFDDIFNAPHSRYTGIDEEAAAENPELEIIAKSDEAGSYLIADKKSRNFFVTGHAEYSRLTLSAEYNRDTGKGLDIMPRHYFRNDDPSNVPVMTWKGHANLLFSNWLNYYVYQRTPYDLADLE